MLFLKDIVGKKFTDACNGNNYTIIDVEEFSPQKRTIRIKTNRNDENGNPYTHKESFFLSFPYLQFYLAQETNSERTHCYVSATNVPISQATEFVLLPLPNITLTGQILFNDEVQHENAAVAFWQSAFSEEWQKEIASFMNANKIEEALNPDANIPPQREALVHWQNKPTVFPKDVNFPLTQYL